MPLPHGNETVSAWMTTEIPNTQKLSENVKVDVCVVGAGIAGITTAYLLSRAGKKVCVLESAEIGSGQTGKTTAHFSTSVDDYYHHLESLHGQKVTQLVADSLKAALDTVVGIVKDENIDCELEKVPGFLFQSNHEKENLLEDELEACHRAGLHEVRISHESPFLSFDSGKCLCFPRQVQLQPLKYLKGLTEAIYRKGGRIYTQTHVEKIEELEKPMVKTKDGFYVTADSVVIATNSPINNRYSLHTKQAPYRSYVVGILIPKGSLPKALYWDTEDPYHYLRVAHENNVHDVLIVGGEDHKTGQGQSPHFSFEKLESWARKKFSFLGHTLYRWSGQVMEPVDKLPFLGKNPGDKNVYVITGDSGDGMTFCTVGAILVSDLIQGRQNPWEKIYEPSRITLRASAEFLKENANVAAQYGKWLVGGNIETLKALPLQEGMILTQGLRKIAVYKDAEGKLEMYSARCPHLHGMVVWNSVEKSWDCPCHGSRFDCHGQVIEGPAVDNLEKFQEQKPVTQSELHPDSMPKYNM